MKNNIIPVVFATNNKYAPFVNVTIASILENSDTNYFYDFYIFYTELNKNTILKKYQNFTNFRINFINVKQYLASNNLYSRAHFSVEMWYRILIPEILNQYDKVLYLDCDLIVTNDISKLYNTDLGNNWLGVVNNLCNNIMRQYVMYLGISPDKYFNSGVLLFNCRLWRTYNLKQQCLDIVNKYPHLNCPDQDILNLVCANNVLYLNLKWNCMWQHLFNKSILTPKLLKIFEKQISDFYILHYTSHIKPWNNPDLEHSKIWWKYANPFRKKLLQHIKKMNIKTTTQKFKLFGIIPVASIEDYV